MQKRIPPLMWVSIAMMGVAMIYTFAGGFQKPRLFLAAICNGGLLWGIVRGSKLAFVLALAVFLASLAYTAGKDRFPYVLIGDPIVVIPMIIEKSHFFQKRHAPRRAGRA